MAELRVHVDNPTTDPVNVSGSITTSPSGTQDVAIVSPTSFSTYVVGNPSITGAYVYSQAQHPGDAGAHNHLSLQNPTGSGKVLVFAGAFISSIIVGDIVNTVAPLRGYRATDIAGGVLEPASAIAKFQTSMPDPAGVVRTEGMTATLGAAVFNSPPLIGASKGSAPFVHQVPVPPGIGAFTVEEGEGLVLRTEIGDIDTRWNLSIVWGEI